MSQQSTAEPTRRSVLWMARVAIALFLSLLIVMGWAIPATSKGRSGQSAAHLSDSPFYQTTQTPTPTPSATPTPAPTLPTLSSSSFQVTLEELGYGEEVLQSPWDTTQYSFRLPNNWLLESDSYLDLDFSYFFTELGRKGGDEAELAFFGELLIYVDGRLLQVYALDAPTLEHVHLRVDLPPELPNEQGTRHNISLALDASLLCSILHKAQLIVHPESTLFLNYGLLPPTLDLDDYPRPFYQRSFDPEQVRFVFPAQPSEMEMRAAAGVAAKLGQLTSGMVISATTDLDWLAMVDTGQAGSEHLFVIGQPSRNRLIAWLNDHAALPISIHRREMSLSTQGPTAIKPGDTFSYTITVTNTTPGSVTSLSLSDQLPRQTSLVSCRPQCAEVGRDEVSWQLASLSPGEVVSFFLTLRLTDTVPLPSQAHFLENMVILANEDKDPLNISSLTTALGPTQGEGMQATSSGQDDYFFIQNGQPVPEGDGVLQEIISPWEPEKVVLLVTGVNEGAIYKASQALSLGASSFPDMKGPTALIRDVRPSPPITATLAADRTLADLGHGNRTVYGVYEQEIEYWFHVPLDWRLNKDAYFRLLFSHSAAIEEQASTLTVLLNGTPLASVDLNKDNATEGILEAKLPDSHIRHGAANEISMRVFMQVDRDECERIDARQVWLSISRDSLLHLDHRVEDINVLDLDYFSFPFDTQSDLSDVLFVLPPFPGPVEQEALLQVAAALGDAANGADFSPAVSLGGTLDAEILNGYHIIALGRPSANSFIQQINSLLPQPFVPGTDEVEHPVGEVLLRLLPGTSLGYIQEIPSPWNEDRALLVVNGTTDEGVIWAVRVLRWQPWRLSGNLVLVREGGEGIEVQAMDTRSLTSSGLASAVTTAMPELTPVATITPTPEAGTDSDVTLTQPTPSPSTGRGKGGLPTWVIFFVGATAVVVLVMFGIARWKFRQRQRR